MTKSSVDYDDVKRICDQLRDDGTKTPSAKQVRAKLVIERAGTGVTIGSPNTIQSLLMRWRNANPVEHRTPQSSQLPPSVTAAVEHLMMAIAQHVQQPLIEQLKAMADDVKVLAEKTSVAKTEISQLQATMLAVTQERDLAQVNLERHCERLQAADQTVVTERAMGRALQLDLARAQVQLEVADERAAAGALREKALDSEIAELRSMLQAANEGYMECRRSIELAEARLKAEQQLSRDAGDRIAELVGAAREHKSESCRASAAEAANQELRAQLAVFNGFFDRMTQCSMRPSVAALSLDGISERSPLLPSDRCPGEPAAGSHANPGVAQGDRHDRDGGACGQTDARGSSA